MYSEANDRKTEYGINSRSKRHWYGIVAILSVFVAFATVYALTFPASTVSETLYCGCEEHTHSKENGCFNEEDELICKTPEHTHTLQCYSNPDCIETPDVWERSVGNIQITDDVRANVIEVAKSQLGYSESTENYYVVYNETADESASSDETATLKGYTRYGAWNGTPYDDWSALFCGFCLEFAGADENLFPFASSPDEWVKVLSDEETNAFRTADEYSPLPGDIVFFDNNDDSVADRAGMVFEFIFNDSDELIGFATIEGDLDNEVQITTRNCAEGHILGYGVLPYESIEDDLKTEDSEITEDTEDTEITEDTESTEDNGSKETTAPAQDGDADIESQIASMAGKAAANKNTVERATGKLDEQKASGTAIGNSSGFANLRNGGTFYLSADITVSSTVNITRTTTLDLNGHKLTVTANPLFNITGGSLTIKDTGSNNDSASTVFDEPYGHAATYTSGTLTYYVTETAVSDADSGITTETLKRHTVSRGGMIVGNKNNRAVNISGGTLNLQGGYICNFAQNNSSGGAIQITGGTVNQSGAVIAANSAKSGGAIYITNNNNNSNNARLNITGGIISGNTANGYNGDNGNSDGGGGILMTGSSVTVTVSGGYITNNIQTNTESDNYWHGGGGVLLAGGARLNLSGGYVTGNYALGGGGGLKTRQSWGGSCGDGGRIYMTGGFLTANNANKSEGGAANINARGYMEITGGYITNNILGGGAEDSEFQDWGGGGLFCSENEATIYVLNALVTDNKAGGFGAGVAGCSTGRISIVGDNGVSIYNNTAYGEHTSGDSSTKNEDHTYALNSPVFMENGYQDYYCALSSTVSGGMLGGGRFMWTGSADGMPITSTSATDTIYAATVMGLTAHPTSGDIITAQEHAQVYITGNESPTHGGGILANGFLIMGGAESVETCQRLEFTATKQLYNKDGLQIAPTAAAYSFVLVDEYGDTVATATNDDSGNIVFDRRIAFKEAGTFTYYLYELQPENAENAGVQYDTSRYRIQVRVSRNSAGTVPGRSDINMYEYRFENITVTEVSASPNTVLYNDNPGNNTTHAISFSPTGGRPFVNREVKAEYVSVRAEKVWSDGASGKSPIEVTLYKDGTAEATATLSSSNGWRYTWNNLPSEANYTVIESPVSGYYPDYAYKYINVTSEVIGTSNEAKLYRKVGNYFVPLNSIESGQQYIIASPDGDKLLCTTHAHADSALSSSDTVSAEKHTGTIRVNGTTYTSWYIASEVPDSCIYTSMTTYTQNYQRIILKNNVEYSWLLVQSTDTGYFKGAAGEDWSSGFRVSNGHLQGQVEWASGNQWRYIIWTGSKFDTDTKLSNIVYTNITDSTKVATVTNTPIAQSRFSLNLLTHDSEDESHVLPNAVFNLTENGRVMRFRYVSGRYTYDVNGSVTELVSDNRGYIRVDGLPVGDYTLTETHPPHGYILPAEAVALTVNESTSSSTISVKVENSEITYELPETGGSGGEIFYFFGAILIIIVAICGVIRFLYKWERRNI